MNLISFSNTPTPRLARGVLGRVVLFIIITITSLVFFQTHQAFATSNITSPDPNPAGDFIGEFTSMVLDQNGYPVITYADGENGTIKIVHCSSTDCTSGDVPVVISPGDRFSSVALDNDGNPVISLCIGGVQSIAHCDSPDCSGTISINVIDSTFATTGTSLAIDSSGNAVVAYYNSANELRVARCSGTDCSSASIATVDVLVDSAEFLSLVLDSNDYPVISYHDQAVSVDDLKLVHCDTVDCLGGSPSIEIIDTVSAGEFSSLVLDSDGNPVIAYSASPVPGQMLKLAHCDNPDCSGVNTLSVVDDGDLSTGWYLDLVLDNTGLPVISYQSQSTGNLMLARCNDVDCAGGDETLAVIDGPGEVGYNTSIAINSGNFVLISYHDADVGHLRLYTENVEFVEPLPPTPPPAPAQNPTLPRANRSRSILLLLKPKPPVEGERCPEFTEYLERGDRDINKGGIKTEVAKLQNFLLGRNFGIGMIADGVFGSQTHQAVMTWQAANASDILGPWNDILPTGRFYQSSKRWANIQLGCDEMVRLDNGVFLDFYK